MDKLIQEIWFLYGFWDARYNVNKEPYTRGDLGRLNAWLAGHRHFNKFVEDKEQELRNMGVAHLINQNDERGLQ